MKAIHKQEVMSDLVNPVDVLVPSGELSGLRVEREGGLFMFHYLADNAPRTVTRQLVFAQAPIGDGVLNGAVLDGVDLTGATYLGCAINLHVWLLA
jgi:hypothetical protein